LSAKELAVNRSYEVCRVLRTASTVCAPPRLRYAAEVLTLVVDREATAVLLVVRAEDRDLVDVDFAATGFAPVEPCVAFLCALVLALAEVD
jgi:hypothetical protein